MNTTRLSHAVRYASIAVFQVVIGHLTPCNSTSASYYCQQSRSNRQ